MYYTKCSGIKQTKKRGNNMSSSKEYVDFIMEQLSLLDDVRYRTMMGEYVLYYKDKVIGGIYDDRFLIKPTKAGIEYIKNPKFELPYKGAKDMLLVENLDNKEYLAELIEKIYPELPFTKKKNK